MSDRGAGSARRQVPRELTEIWKRATDDPDPMAALGASRSLARGVSRWQATLVAEAIRAGSTWEQVGDTLGITRQAAWARFRHVFEEKGDGSMQDRIDELKGKIHEEVRGLREAMKAIDESHRKARTEARDRLREVERQARQERQQLQAQMKETVRSLQEELRGLGKPA